MEGTSWEGKWSEGNARQVEAKLDQALRGRVGQGRRVQKKGRTGQGIAKHSKAGHQNGTDMNGTALFSLILDRMAN